MYRQRTRPKYSEDQLRAIYATPHDHLAHDWPDHVLRVEATLQMALEFVEPNDRCVDLSCGNAYMASQFPTNTWMLGDYAPGYQLCGPIEETLNRVYAADVFFLLETLEHLDNPDSVLIALRPKTRKLILSTPICTFLDDNEEHYWAWDQDAVMLMLETAGFDPVLYRETFYDPGYCFQIWGCL